MTREEAVEFIAQSVKSDVDMAKVADAIKALEQEPCEDYVSREYLSTTIRANTNFLVVSDKTEALNIVESAPPVT